MAKYINKLTVEDLEALDMLCFKDNEGPDRIFFPISPKDDNIRVITTFGSEFIVKDFSIGAISGYRTKSNIQTLFVAYMYKRFGEEYITDYTEAHYHVKQLREKVKELVAMIGAAKRKSEKDVAKLRILADKLFPKGIDKLQIKIRASYEDPEDPASYEYMDLDEVENFKE